MALGFALSAWMTRRFCDPTLRRPALRGGLSHVAGDNLARNGAWRLDVTLAFCFRPEFSVGGYSGNLWAHERWDLIAYSDLKRKD